MPGGSYAGDFHPVVNMSRNMLPFEWNELKRYGWSIFTLKLLLLRLTQSRTYKKTDGLIFLTDYARQAVVGVAGALQAKTSTIPHGMNPRFNQVPKPHYNSAVATFCYNIARDFPIQINDPSAALTLVYVDDVLERFIQLMDGAEAAADDDGFAIVTPQYSTTVGALAAQIHAFKESRSTLLTECVGVGLMRALYATYVSYLPVESFAYPVQQHADACGVFVEMLKTPDCGQFSYFTANPGITRGGHYHHSKTEKFLVIKGQARFKFRHMRTGETFELMTNGAKAEIVETVPGWTHDITNMGEDEMVVMLWANEVFDRARPDTFACKV